VTVDLELTIPVSDFDGVNEHKFVPISVEDVHFMNQFTCSTKSKLIEVEYTLKGIIKHDCWNEFGEGYAVSCPIKIRRAPVAAKILGVPEFQVPQNWAPDMRPAFFPQ